MGVQWTEEQQKVINVRNRNILVSAAAGSGKTAVLVERIITRLTEESPIDVDRLLVVTYTEAAAAEMKERIREAIEQKLNEDSENAHLKRQATLIHNALITTIHSFCLSVIREHFHAIDLDPGFRIAEEGELKLLKHDVMQELLESEYASGKEEFLDFVERFATGKDDKKLEELILQVYEFSRSYPDPERWLADCAAAYDIKTEEQLDTSVCAELAKKHAKACAEDGMELLGEGLKICDELEGPHMYRAALEADLQVLSGIKSATGYVEMSEIVRSVKWARLASNRDKNVSEELASYVKSIREEVKAMVKELTAQYFYDKPEALKEDMEDGMSVMQTFTGLVQKFSEAFSAKKSDKNLIDFGDMEQFALRILTRKEGDNLVPSETAEEYQEWFEEVMIDEYQDSNLIQEAILKSVSSVDRGKYNIFMVGDVKQSIYRFRLSRPELFMEKYDTYSTAGENEQRIDLHKNFRSRREVLHAANFIFGQIMTKDLGGVAYDDKAALYTGADYEEKPGNETEVLLVDIDMESDDTDAVRETARELEARAAARRIKELVGTKEIYDKSIKAYRKAGFRDIVILTRSLKGWTDVFAEVLNREGIPTYTGSKEGYFETLEISVLLNYLRILDNKKQDLPLASVLVSPIAGLDSEMMAYVRSEFPDLAFHEAVVCYAAQGKNKEIAGKLSTFFEQLGTFREMVPYTAIHDLLHLIIEDTGYGDYISAMPGGEQRRANLEMLIEKAVAFEATSYKGLFNFVRYMEQLQKYDIDYGEASIEDEASDTVRLMSIHKSKGLEFPIVIVAGMSKHFNMQDTKGSIVVHPELGIGMDAIDLTRRTKAPTFLKKVIQNEVREENLGEELRVLYVALTRAKEKLILLGTVSSFEKKIQEYARVRNRKARELSMHQLTKAGTYYDWVLPSLVRHRSFAGLLKAYGLDVPFTGTLYDEDVPVLVHMLTLEEIVTEEILEEMDEAALKETFTDWDAELVREEQERKRIEEQFSYRYPYETEEKLKLKFTVSELKKREYLSEESGEILMEEPEVVPLLPKFLTEDEELKGASRGSAYHKLLELLDFTKGYTAESLRKTVEEFQNEGRISKEMADCIRYSDILKFLESDAAKRMQQAAVKGLLKKEQPFVIGVDSREIYPGEQTEDLILVQGIIDVYFEEDGDLIVLDYKTDRVNTGADLREKYHAQLDYYAKALEQLTGKNVKEKWIYSFTLKEEIAV